MQPRVNFINVLRIRFLYEILAPKITKLCFGLEIFWLKNIGAKCAHKMLMILTTILTLDQTNGRAYTKKHVATTYISLHIHSVSQVWISLTEWVGFRLEPIFTNPHAQQFRMEGQNI